MDSADCALLIWKNESQFHQELLFEFEKSLWNMTWTCELYKKHSQWVSCKAAAKYSPCNQGLGDGSPHWWRVLWKLLVGNKVLACSELFTLPLHKQLPPPYKPQSDLSCKKKKAVAGNQQVTLSMTDTSVSKFALVYFSKIWHNGKPLKTVQTCLHLYLCQ